MRIFKLLPVDGINEWNPPRSGFYWLIRYISLSLFSRKRGIFCDMLEHLPSISAPYLYICLFYHLDVDVV